MSEINALPLTSDALKKRLRARISPPEFLALGIVFIVVLCFVYLVHTGTYFPYDYRNYRNGAFGNVSFYYYGYWFLPFFRILSFFSDELQVFIFYLVNIACIFFAARIFGGKRAPILFSYQMFYVIYFGQLTGILVGGMALLWWGIVNKRWNMAGIGLLILVTKFQLGIPIALTLGLLANISWSDRLRILVIPILVGLLSLAVYGLWPIEVFQRITVSNPPNDLGSIALWNWFGPIVLLLWIPVLSLPMSLTQRVIAVIATSALALPYFQQADLIALYVFPVGWLPLFSVFGFLNPFLEFSVLKAMAILPIIIYIWVIQSSLRQYGLPRFLHSIGSSVAD